MSSLWGKFLVPWNWTQKLILFRRPHWKLESAAELCAPTVGKTKLNSAEHFLHQKDKNQIKMWRHWSSPNSWARFTRLQLYSKSRIRNNSKNIIIDSEAVSIFFADTWQLIRPKCTYFCRRGFPLLFWQQCKEDTASAAGMAPEAIGGQTRDILYGIRNTR